MRFIAMLVVMGLVAGTGVAVEEEVEDKAWAQAVEELRGIVAQGPNRSAMETIDLWIATLEKDLGPEHRHVRRALSTAGRVAYGEGQEKVAARLLEDGYQRTRGRFGEEHLETLRARRDLLMPVTTVDQGEVVLARGQILDLATRLLGPEHPETLAAHANLAASLLRTEDLSEAQRRFEDLVVANTKCLGASHVDTLLARANLARVLRLSGAPSADRVEGEVLAELRDGFGVDAPSLRHARANLAGFVYELRAEDLRPSPGDAERLIRHLLRSEGILSRIGTDRIAPLLSAVGDMVSSIEVDNDLLAIKTRVLEIDLENPVSLGENTSAFAWLGNIWMAGQRRTEVMSAQEWHSGIEHPDFLPAWINMNAAFRGIPVGEATSRYESVQDLLRRFLGSDHPDTLMSGVFLAGSLPEASEATRALEIYNKIWSTWSRLGAETHPVALEVLFRIASLHQKGGELALATPLLERWIELRRAGTVSDHRSDTLQEARALFVLASNYRLSAKGPPSAEGFLETAFKRTLEGLDALESSAQRIDTSELNGTGLTGLHEWAYRSAVELALVRGRLREALEVLERYRTQSLRRTLRWGRAVDADGTPEALRRELADVSIQYRALLREAAEEYPATGSLRDKRNDLRQRRREIRGEILEARRGGGEPAKPLRFEAIRSILDRGTLLLAYSAGREETHLFVLDSKGRIDAYPLEVDLQELWRQVERLRSMDGVQSRPEGRTALASWLYRKLIAPAAARIADADRLLVLPDGPLHLVPFASLVSPASVDSPNRRYLVEAVSVTVVQSATVLAELRAGSRERANAAEPELDWVGLGSPDYPDEQGVGTPPAKAVERGLWDGLRHLPHSGREIEEVADLFPAKRRAVRIGESATEEAVRALTGRARIAHFAVHGLADPEFPMDSFLAFAGDEDRDSQIGLLHAWEIVDQLRLDADLVVLSACVTAFGPDQGGEGLLSLSRAFQVAGARSVLASLWAVHDASTAELMIRFYRHLLAGQTKDAALRSAQLELIRGPIPVPDGNGGTEMRDFSAPYHWGAFQLIGDYR
ncbi:MAG: CHAT domain-containing tetratricopeptide repeat protein [Acidobacteriota bacterium]